MLRIAIVGAESTGKTQLAGQLGEHLGLPILQEAARTYLSGRPAYDWEDVEHMARLQWNGETRLLEQGKGGVFDTNLLVTMIWSEFVFKRPSLFSEAHFDAGRFDACLLCCPDLPWEPDPLREHPHQREEIHALYLSKLRRYGVTFSEIRGVGSDRFKNALRALGI
jgi:nicotinamide riboside kinase